MNRADTRRPQNPGILASLRAFLTAGLSYLSARARLIGMELRHATAHFAVMGLLAAALVLLALMGYFLLVLSATFALATLIGEPHGFAWAALIAAFSHFAIAGVVFVLLRKKARESLFQASIEELKKDHECLTSNPKA